MPHPASNQLRSQQEIMNEQATAQFKNIAGAATTLVKSGKGRLYSLIINKPIATGVITIYDNVTNSGTLVGTITNPAALLQQQVIINYGPMGVLLNNGLTVVTSAADDITLVYS